jgi:hypothetical protein
MKGSPLRRSPLRRRGFARQQRAFKESQRHRDFERELDLITPELVRRSGGCCELCGGRLHPKTWERHHRKRRDPHDPHSNDLSNLLLLGNAWSECNCHGWAHANVADAKKLGVILSSWQDPEAVPVQSWMLKSPSTWKEGDEPR